jgi:hypothetical protein
VRRPHKRDNCRKEKKTIQWYSKGDITLSLGILYQSRSKLLRYWTLKTKASKELWKSCILYGLYLPFFSDLQLEVTRYFRIYAPGIEGMFVFEFKSFVKLREKLHTYLFFRFFRAAVNMHRNKFRMVAHRFVSDVLYDGRTYVKRNKTNILSYYRRTFFGPD